MMPVTLSPADATIGEESVNQEAELVRRPVAERVHPPTLHERLPVEDAEHDVGVADVDC